MTPTELRRRLAALERRPAGGRCADPWHQRRWTGPQPIDYRHSIRALAPDGAEDRAAPAPAADRCPACGAARPQAVTVVALPFPPYLQQHTAAERIARRLLEPTEPTEEGAPTADDHD